MLRIAKKNISRLDRWVGVILEERHREVKRCFRVNEREGMLGNDCAAVFRDLGVSENNYRLGGFVSFVFVLFLLNCFGRGRVNLQRK